VHSLFIYDSNFFFFFSFRTGCHLLRSIAYLLACLLGAETNSSLSRLFPRFERFGHMAFRRIIDMGMAFHQNFSDAAFMLLHWEPGWTGWPTYDM
jgi:hypothetical protein